MPRFDQHCLACGWADEVIVPPGVQPPCPTCGGETERVWQGTMSVIGDEIPGGVLIENLGPEPIRFDSKRAIVQAAAARGLEPMVRHVPGSKHTTSWDVPSATTLAQGAVLAARQETTTVSAPHDDTPAATKALVAETWVRLGGD